jgi:hypothetical protein
MSREQRRYPPNIPGSSGATSSISRGGRCPGGLPDMASPRRRTPKATGQDTEMAPGLRPGRRAPAGRGSSRNGTAGLAAPGSDPPDGAPTAEMLTGIRIQGLTADPPSPRPLLRSPINPPARPSTPRPEPTPGTAPRGPLPSGAARHHERHVRQDPTGHSPADQAEGPTRRLTHMPSRVRAVRHLHDHLDWLNYMLRSTAKDSPRSLFRQKIK